MNYPEKCPVTGREYWGTMEHSDKGIIPLYGGPFDSYTIPEMMGEPSQQWHERELVCEHYDHDAGCWKDPEIIPLRIVNEQYLFELEKEKAELLEKLKQICDGCEISHDKDNLCCRDKQECDKCGIRALIAKAEGK